MRLEVNKLSNKVKVIPYGMTLGAEKIRPAMIFKDESQKEVLPVWLDPVDAGVLLSRNQRELSVGSPHEITVRLFAALSVKILSVYFNEISGSTQYAEIEAEQKDKKVKIRVRAADVMSLAALLGCEFYTNREVIEKSRELNLQWLNFEGDVKAGKREELH